MAAVITEVLGSRHCMVEVSGNMWKRHVNQLLSRAVDVDPSNSPSIKGHSMPIQLAPPGNFLMTLSHLPQALVQPLQMSYS